MLILVISNGKNLLFLLKFVVLIHSVKNTLCMSYISIIYTYNLNKIEYIMGAICNYM